MMMQERLEAIEDRYDELEGLMADPEVAVDYTHIQRLAKEQATIRTIVELSREFRDVQTQLDDVRGLLREESDGDMIALAREEEAELLANIERIEFDLRVELIPKDPNDEKNVISGDTSGNRRRRSWLVRFRPVPHVHAIRAAQRLADRGHRCQPDWLGRNQGDCVRAARQWRV